MMNKSIFLPNFFMSFAFAIFLQVSCQNVPKSNMVLAGKVTSTPISMTSKALEQQYLSSQFRVVALVNDPALSKSIVIAGRRSPTNCGSATSPEKCSDDSTCGSIYSESACYFFIEPNFYRGEKAFPSFLATWEGKNVDSLLIDSVKRWDVNTLEFKTAGGDGAYSIKRTIHLDLVSGKFSETARDEKKP